MLSNIYGLLGRLAASPPRSWGGATRLMGIAAVSGSGQVLLSLTSALGSHEQHGGGSGTGGVPGEIAQAELALVPQVVNLLAYANHCRGDSCPRERGAVIDTRST